jgi:hypothetical protein
MASSFFENSASPMKYASGATAKFYSPKTSPKKNSSPTNYVTYELIDDGAGGYKKIYKGRDVIRNAYGLIECYIE